MPDREKSFWPNDWFCDSTWIPVIVLGLYPKRKLNWCCAVIRWSNRNELNVVRSVMGKTVCRLRNGRKAMGCPRLLTVEIGMGAPLKKNRLPTTVPGVNGAPVAISGLNPSSAVLPPPEARYA